MTLSWYLNRLRSMEPAEVAHRLVEKGRKWVSKRSHQGWSAFAGQELQPVLPSLSARVLGASPAQRDAIAVATAEILAGRYCALGRDWPQRQPDALFPPDLWRLDPVTASLWPGPQTYAFDIDFRHDGTKGDIKYVWEINRLQFLPVLATQYCLSGDGASLRAIADAIDSWHAANPPFGGVGWASGIEVALRAINIVVTLALVGDRLGDTTRENAAQIVSASAFWLPRFPSRFSSANNHLVAELAGEHILARALGRHDGGAWGHLLAELDRQILPDGAGAEQTPTYAAFTAELVLVAALVARDAGVDLPAASKERLMALARFIAWVGPGATFGDNDEGRVLTSAHEADYPASVASAIAGFVGGPHVGEPADDFRALLLGAPSQSAAVPSGLMTFTHGGLSVWRGAINGHQVNLRFDHGPLGYLSIAAHGHADALSIALDIDGQPVLVDPGTYLYGSGGPWRSWFRATPAHNTLSIAGQSQSIMSGAFNWSHKAQAQLVARSDSPDWSVSAEHDGYARRFGVTHQRTLRRDADTIAVQDRLIGPARDAEIVFQLAPELTAQADGNVVLVSRAGVPLLAIALPSADFTVAAGGDTPGQGGWVSTRFGIKTPAARIAWQGPVDSSGVLSRLTLLGH